MHCPESTFNYVAGESSMRPPDGMSMVSKQHFVGEATTSTQPAHGWSKSLCEPTLYSAPGFRAERHWKETEILEEVCATTRLFVAARLAPIRESTGRIKWPLRIAWAKPTELSTNSTCSAGSGTSLTEHFSMESSEIEAMGPGFPYLCFVFDYFERWTCATTPCKS